MEQRSGQRESDLFTIRIWRQVLADGDVEWRGRVQHVLRGEVYYFRSWDVLVEQLKRILSDTQDDIYPPNGQGRFSERA